MIVLDTSALLELLLGTRDRARVASRVASAAVLNAPHLIDVEVLHVLRRYERGGVIPSARAEVALRALGALDLDRHPHEPLLRRAFELRKNLTAYDAIYVALAEALDAPLVTRDERLVRAPGVRAEIEVV